MSREGEKKKKKKKKSESWGEKEGGGVEDRWVRGESLSVCVCVCVCVCVKSGWHLSWDQIGVLELGPFASGSLSAHLQPWETRAEERGVRELKEKELEKKKRLKQIRGENLV